MLGLQYAGSTWLHETNEYGICKHCGRFREEIKAGNYFCFRKKGLKFEGPEYIKAPRHPLFQDCIKEIRSCGYCQNTRSGFCKRHKALKMFLETSSKTVKERGSGGKLQ